MPSGAKSLVTFISAIFMNLWLHSTVRGSDSRRVQVSNMHSCRRTGLSSLHLLLLTALAAPSVVASVIPPITRTDLHPTISHGRIVGGDHHRDISHSPPGERAEWDRQYLRDVTVQVNHSLDESAANTPILVAPANDETPEDNNHSTKSTLTARSNSDSSIPTPFDSNLSTNFTSDSCPKFFKKFLSDAKFTKCYAMSTLLRDSSSFFQTLKSAPATSRLLDLACAADVSDCSKVMSDLASRITKSDACGKDYSLGNPVVTSAYTDMIIYEPMYRATCLKNPTTLNYCFVDAATNTSNTADYDVYFVPYGSPITAKPYPTCNKCVQASMDLFSQWAQKDGQPLIKSYLPTAKALNSKCGDSFANVNITLGSLSSTSSATWSASRPDIYLTACIVALSIGVSFGGLF
ncbi:hypothetical protein BDV25DRAFT_163762 [Aspergillus avenaceus]|uniref:DUF7729 domain-containing protein n=1 Tax=Aspergillus avenaceus TaxID=36643 RepID=A0A5N6THU7_ASPAV|nr:hypothetical protein BDV25DRAFT_163762 [Aspergillus avenaceus]